MNVLITEESGVGKELVVRALHYYTIRSEQPFIQANCAAPPSKIVLAELFGYKKGISLELNNAKPESLNRQNNGQFF